MRLIDADALCEGRTENDPVVIAAKCADTIIIEETPEYRAMLAKHVAENGLTDKSPIVCESTGSVVNIDQNCFACQYDIEVSGIIANCMNCPLRQSDGGRGCGYPDGIYDKWGLSGRIAKVCL